MKYHKAAHSIHIQIYVSRMVKFEDVNITFNLFFPYIKSKGIYNIKKESGNSRGLMA